MSDPDDKVERSNRHLRPWLFGLLAVLAVGVCSFILTHGKGWHIAFGLLVMLGGLVVVVVAVRELISFRRSPG